VEKAIETTIDHMPLGHNKLTEMLNMVVRVQKNRTTPSLAHVVLCSSDVRLASALVIDSDRLRFQLEFHFRDAKQSWGLEDCMTVQQTPVYNRANLAMVMVNLSHTVMRSMRGEWPEVRVTDLQAWFRGRKYVVDTLKLLPEMPDPICMARAIDQMAQ
jgi:putative transposase